MGVVSTRVPLDREQHRALLVPLVVGDAGSPPLTATVTLTLHVADLNDNLMWPAAKTVTALTIKVCVCPAAPSSHWPRRLHMTTGPLACSTRTPKPLLSFSDFFSLLFLLIPLVLKDILTVGH